MCHGIQQCLHSIPSATVPTCAMYCCWHVFKSRRGAHVSWPRVNLHRLATTSDVCDACAEYEVFDFAWAKPCSEESFTRSQTAAMAASLILRLMMHEPALPPDSTLAHLPTPSPPQWAAVQASASKALVALHWSKHNPEGTAQFLLRPACMSECSFPPCK